MYVLLIVVCPFVSYLLVIMLSVLQYTDSDYPFGIFNLFFSIRGTGWYIFIKVWKIYNGKVEAVSFVIKSGKKLTIGVKFMVNIKK